MTITTPLPSPPQTSDPANFSTKADAFIAALPVFQAELDAYASTLVPLGSRNLLVNPAFQINQEGPATNADDTYCFDVWNVLTQTGTVQVTSSNPESTGFTNCLRITQSQATAQRFGISQIIEGKNCKHGHGNSGTLVPRVTLSVSTNVRYAILGWISTEDSPTSDVVNSWTNSTYTAGQFFISSNLTVLGVSASQAVVANTYTTLPALTASLGTTFTNIIILIWTESAQAQNVTFDASYVQFEIGASANPFERRSVAQELVNVQRYYSRTAAGSTSTCFGSGVCYSTTAAQFYIKHPVTMRTTPVVGTNLLAVFDGAVFPITSVTSTGTTAEGTTLQTTSSGAGLTAKSGALLAPNASASAWIDFNARM